MFQRFYVACLIFTLTMTACAPIAPASAPTPVPPTSTSALAEAAMTPSVTVNDQAIVDGAVTIAEVVSSGSGWIVIHADQNGGPGPVIGYTAVADGVNKDVVVKLDVSKVTTPTLYAMLHMDAGAVGTYEFPGPDGPVEVEGKVITPAFRVTSGLPSAGAKAATVMVASNEQLGSFLVDAKGMTLYIFLNDTPNTSNCYDACAQNWPPLLAEGTPVAGEGVDASLLGTTQRKDGTTQVTYNGWPLYYFVRDEKPGDTNGQGVRDVWFVISPQGEKIGGAAESEAGQVPGGQMVTVIIRSGRFGEGELTVAPGTTVIWQNESGSSHTVTADSGLFDSGELVRGAKFQFTFTEEGEYPYYCRYHGEPGGRGMANKVIVKR